MSQRLNKDRYAVHGGWRRASGWSGLVEVPTGVKPAVIDVQVADLLEVRSGHVWSNGAYRVTLTNVPDMRSKTFYGETAWCDAARHARDAASKCGDWRWDPDL